MLYSRRSVARAGALTLAAASLAACSDSTAPRDLSVEELQTVAEAVAFEMEGSVMQLTAQDAMGSVDAPVFSLRSRTARRMLRNDPLSLRLSAQVAGDECGVPSQTPPTDTDADGVPDNFSLTFALPACHFTDVDGSMDMTGVVRVSDPQPGTSGMALTFSLDDFRVAFSGAEMSGHVFRDGTTSVSASETGLSQMMDWTESAEVTGHPALGVDIDWTATFAAAEGQSIIAGQPLPDGLYVPNGTVQYREGRIRSALAVSTPTPLQYSAACAAGVIEGTAVTPFTGGEARVAFAGPEGRGFVRVTYANCDYATVAFVAQQ